MNVLILGDASDDHAVHLQQALMQTGATVDYFNTYLFPTQLQLSWTPNDLSGSLTLSSERQLNLRDIKSVFWRSFNGVGTPTFKDNEQQAIALDDSMSAMRSLMQACPARWINSWQAYQFHKEKPLQLKQVKDLGIKIPQTLITNHPEKVIQFAQNHAKVIFKPVYGGAHTQMLTEAHLEPKRLGLSLRLSPVTLQTYIPGTNIRTYVIADSVYGAEIRSPALDFREDSQAELIRVILPEAIQQQCLAIAKALSLEWTAIDWRLTPDGDYIFLEANPSPMFVYFEQQTGFPLTDQLVQLLLR